MSSYTTTFTHTVDGGAKATGTAALNTTNVDSASTVGNGVLGQVIPASGSEVIPTQKAGQKCQLQVDVVRPSASAVDTSTNNDRAVLAELVRGVAAQQEGGSATTNNANIKSVYIRVEFAA